MKNLTLITSIAFLTLGAHAQSNFKYSSPEAREFEPIAIETAMAKTEAASLTESCGYSKVFYSKADLENLMNLSNCVGVRFYNGLADEKDANCQIIAVAVTENGKEIGHGKSSSYLHASSYDQDAKCTAHNVTKSNARSCVEHVANHRSFVSQKVFFSRDFLKARMAKADGVVLIPAYSEEANTMMVAGATLEDGQISELEGNYYKSQLPCPTDCGNPGNYLVSPD